MYTYTLKLVIINLENYKKKEEKLNKQLRNPIQSNKEET